MSENNLRSERKKKQKNKSKENKGSLSKFYYWIIGILFLILLLLVLYIFTKGGNQVDLGDEEATSSLVQQNKQDQDGESTESEEMEKNNQADEDSEIEQETNEEDDEDETVVSEDAPLDTDHAVDYTNGSADRIAIKNKVMQVTGLGNDLIENWVGNNGPGRVVADVHDPEQTEIYRVYLQYGDGDWHVTSYERLNSISNN